MARKKRRFENLPAPPADDKSGKKPVYRDAFQEKLSTPLEELGKKLEGQGRNILYVIGALVVVAIIAWIFVSWNRKSDAEAQAALGKAIVTSQARITDIAPPAGSEEKTFKTVKERSEASIQEFNAVAEKFGGAVGEKARYFAATSRLLIDRDAGVAELEALSKSSGEAGTMAKFALAQAKADMGQYDVAAALYKELLDMSDPILAKETISFELAGIYEKQEKKDDAVNTLFDLVKKASEAKDLEGKPVAPSSTVQKAREKLEELSPEKAKELPTPEPLDLSNFGL
ncbi:MAG: hypothetical protein KF855_15485 [Acidobacteria bacterium]|nr:hypothetical protein [Acidobacteriota bacterium]